MNVRDCQCGCHNVCGRGEDVPPKPSRIIMLAILLTCCWFCLLRFAINFFLPMEGKS